MTNAPPPVHSAENWLRDRAKTAAGPEIRRATVLHAIAAALVVPQAWLLARATAAVVIEQAPLMATLPWLAPVLPILLLRFVLSHLADRAALSAGARTKATIRNGLLSRIGGGPSQSAVPMGEAATTVIEGVDALEPYVSRYLAHLGLVATLPLVILAVVMPRDWISGLVLLVTAPVIPLFMVLLGRKAEQMNQRQWRELTRLSARLLDGLQRLGALKVLNATAREERLLADAAEGYRQSTMAVLRVAFLSSLALEFFATIGIALVAVLIGFRLLGGMMTFETGFFVLLLAPEFYAPLRQLGADHHARMEALVAATRVMTLTEAPKETAGAIRPDLSCGIVLTTEALSFGWSKGQPALSDISLRLAPGEITALTGPSGAGKSTLLSMLLGFQHPDTGRIVVNGHDLAKIDPAFWMDQIALVPQRPHMFAGSVLDNIRLSAPEASLAQVRAAARAASADEFIMALPQGYDTALGEHGMTLSGGQVQRIALARAFMKDRARVLIMDEGAAGLDRQTEETVARAVRKLAQGRTTLLVAHRQATLDLADRVIFMDAGRMLAADPRRASLRPPTVQGRLLFIENGRISAPAASTLQIENIPLAETGTDR